MRAVSGSLKGRVMCCPSCESPRAFVRMVLGEAMELEDTENNEIVIGDF